MIGFLPRYSWFSIIRLLTDPHRLVGGVYKNPIIIINMQCILLG